MLDLLGVAKTLGKLLGHPVSTFISSLSLDRCLPGQNATTVSLTLALHTLPLGLCMRQVFFLWAPSLPICMQLPHSAFLTFIHVPVYVGS